MVEIYKALNVIMAFHILLLYPTLVRQCGDDDVEGGDGGNGSGDDGDDTDDDVYFGEYLHYPGLIIKAHNFHSCGNFVTKVSGPI